jgi:thiazole synthase ThiGH ThiG subunit
MRVYDAITMQRKIGCGNIYCIFNEKEGEFYNLIIKGDNAKEAPCGESWLNSMAAILTYALRRSMWEGTAQKAIVKHLLNHRCQVVVPNSEHIVSCSDAIGRMVLEYLKARGLDE